MTDLDFQLALNHFLELVRSQWGTGLPGIADIGDHLITEPCLAHRGIFFLAFLVAPGDTEISRMRCDQGIFLTLGIAFIT